MLSASLSSCASGGPKVTVCVVDALRMGYQCVDYRDQESFRPFSDSKDLACASPDDTEAFLKACKAGKLLPIPLCQYDSQGSDFKCKSVENLEFRLAVDQADNYACLSERDRKRIIERCIEG